VRSPFRLDELGSLEFQRLCVALLGLELGGFEQRSWGLSLLAADGAPAHDLEGPTLVLVVWERRGAASSIVHRSLRNVVADAFAVWQHPVRSLLLATNAAIESVDVPDGVTARVLGPDRLWALFRSSPSARLRAPSALGVADLDVLVPAEVAQRSTTDIPGAAELAGVFVPTAAYAHALDVVERHHFAVLTGPPEMGKTAIARMIGLATLTNGWEVHECTRPDDLWARFDRGRRQVFIADDAFGSTEYRPEAAERWAVDLDRVLRSMDERHWLLWTSRPAPFKAGLRRLHREHGVERFPQPAEVGIDAAALDVTEKALILFRHAKHAGLSDAAVGAVRLNGWRIVGHEHFTPERIRRFVGSGLPAVTGADEIDVRAIVVAAIREPTEAMASSYRALAPEQRAVLLALLDVPPGPATERELTAAVRRHAPAGLAHPINETVDRLADHFLRHIQPCRVTWVHPSWRDLVIEELADDAEARRRFIGFAGVHGVLLALSTEGGARGERTLPLLASDRDWDAVADRIAVLVSDLDAPEVTVLLGALAEARAAAPGEGDPLATGVLGQLARTWDRSHAAIEIGLLQAWFALSAELTHPPSPPSPALTWFELVPTDSIDLETDVPAFDDWTTLAELLAVHAPDALRTLRFPDDHRHVIRRFVEDIARAVDEDVELPHFEAVVRTLQRLWRLDESAADAYAVAHRLRRDRRLREQLKEPVPQIRPLSRELQRLLDAPLPTRQDARARVERVLRDL
jgi:uncharacterized protein (DUF1778 family)